MRFWFLTIVVLLFAQGISAQLCELFNNCTKPPAEPSAPSASKSAAPSNSSGPKPSASSAVPSPTSAASARPSASIPKSSAPPSPTKASTPPTTSTDEPSTTSLIETSTTATPSTTSSPKSDDDNGGSNIGVIVGSVCGFVAIIGAGFAYAFFSKTRRNNRDKRLYAETGDSYPDASYQPDHYPSRPSPAITASAVAAADQIHSSHQWDNQPYNYGNAAPQTPMVAVAKQHDPYYSPAPVPQMGYSTSDTYYGNQQQYYDPNAAAYYDPQQHHYDPNYIDSQKQQHDMYAQQQQQDLYAQQHDPHVQHHPSPALNQATVVPTQNVYSVPHTYSDEDQGVNKNNSNSYR